MQTTERKFDLVSMGDLMIDFSCVGKSKAGRLLYERNPGGGPMNVAAQLSRLGGKAGSTANTFTIWHRMTWVLT